jgi:hypothetical protein
MKIFFFAIAFYNFNCFGQLNDLNFVYLQRIKAETCKNNLEIDSAIFIYNKIVRNDVYVNATDFLSLASCYLIKDDTNNFKMNIEYAFKLGADSVLSFSYFKKLSNKNDLIFKDFLRTNYSQLILLNKPLLDTLVIQELDDILYLDQLFRGNIKVSESNYDYILTMSKYLDSVNLVRIKKLITSNKYPGFHNFGIMSSKYDQILMHISDYSEIDWKFIFEFLKKEVLLGNITPNQLVSITTRHYGNMARGIFNNKCSYYGSQRRGNLDLCDCMKVDEFRKSIGLDDLKSEFNRLNIKLPECYGKR